MQDLLEELERAQNALGRILDHPKLLNVTDYADLTVARELVESIRKKVSCRQ